MERTEIGLTEITVARPVPAPPEQVFDVWVDPKCPGGPWFGAARLIFNPVVDGLFFFAVEHAGKTWPHYGRFTHLDRAQVVEFTWMSEATQGLESLVRVTFEAKGAETEVTLHHTRVPDDEMGRQHKDGWTWMLNALAECFTEKKAAV